MWRTNFITLVFASAALFASPASAAINLTATFKGTVSKVTGSSIFSNVSVGDSWTSTYVYDLSLGQIITSPTSYITFGGDQFGAPSPVLSATLTIGGTSRNVLSDSSATFVWVNQPVSSQIMSGADHRTSGVGGITVLDYITIDGLFPAGIDAFPNFTLSALSYSDAYFENIAPDNSIIERYEAVLTSVNIASAVPEPATWAMMIIGFGFVGAALRRAQRSAAQEIVIS